MILDFPHKAGVNFGFLSHVILLANLDDRHQERRTPSPKRNVSEGASGRPPWDDPPQLAAPCARGSVAVASSTRRATPQILGCLVLVAGIGTR
jgi:hypothetical protein